MQTATTRIETIGARARKGLALAAVLAAAAAAAPTPALAFNPQPDPPGATAGEDVSAGDTETRAIGDEENKFVQDSESGSTTRDAAPAGADAAIQDSESDGASETAIRDEVN